MNFDNLESILKLMPLGGSISIGGNGAISIGGVNNSMQLGQGTCSLRVGRGSLDSRTQKIVYDYFEKHAHQIPLEKDSLTIPERLLESVRLINAFTGKNTEQITENMTDPDEEIAVAERLHLKIMDLLRKNVEQTGRFELTEDGFDQNLDKAERHIVQVYLDLFHYYSSKKLYEFALRLVAKIKHVGNASELCCELALNFFKAGKTKEMIAALNEASEITSEISDLIERMPSEDLLMLYDQVANKAFKKTIVFALLNQGRVEECLGLVGDLDTEGKTRVYREIIAHYWKSKDIASILQTIPKFYHTDDKTREYRKIIDYYWESKSISSILNIIPNFYHTDDKTREYRKIIDHHWKNGDLNSIKNVIPNFYHTDDKTREYKRLIDHFWNSNQIDEILNIIPNFYHTDDKTHEYKKIISFYWQQLKLPAILSIIPNLYHTPDKTEEYLRVIDYCLNLQPTEFKKNVGVARQAITCLYYNEDKQRCLKRLNDKIAAVANIPDTTTLSSIPKPAPAQAGINLSTPPQQKKVEIPEPVLLAKPAALAAPSNDEDEDMVCPITGELMKDPWVDPEGNSYEKAAIFEWLEKNMTSPITRKALKKEQMAPNRALKKIIEKKYPK